MGAFSPSLLWSPCASHVPWVRTCLPLPSNAAILAQVLVGELVGARLIAHAGSLMTLAKYPASTVQILGAEKVAC